MARNAFLLSISYLFYCAWDYRFLSLIIASTTIDYAAGIALKKFETKKKYWLYFSILSNLGVLFFFKYFNFFLDSLNFFIPESQQIGSLSIILPIGISFYTFQSLSYTIDVYRGVQKPERNYITFALYVAFFPQILAGPIERASRLIPQFKVPIDFDWNNLRFGFERFLIGMIKKVAISPAIFAYSNVLFLNPSFETVTQAWVKGGLWFLYLLMDFSGYSDMAIGIARMLGIKLSENFNSVFKTKSYPDFWKRWHITLGEWFRDYVHTALQHKGLSRYIAGFLSFTLIGVWHGASLNFLIWGIGMGLLWIIDIRYNPIDRIALIFPRILRPVIRTTCFLGSFLILGPFFAAHNVQDAGVILKTMIGFGGTQNGSSASVVSTSLIFSICLAAMVELVQTGEKKNGPSLFSSSAIGANFKLFVLIPLGILLCFEGIWSSVEFKYFQF